MLIDDEATATEQWSKFLARAAVVITTLRGGTLVKSLGDGLLATFDEVDMAFECAQDLVSFADELSVGLPKRQALHLRTAIHWTTVRHAHSDVFGLGVSLTARLASLADPGEVVFSEDAWHRCGFRGLVPAMAIPPSFLKHFPSPIATYRVKCSKHPVLDAECEADGPELVIVQPTSEDSVVSLIFTELSLLLAQRRPVRISTCLQDEQAQHVRSARPKFFVEVNQVQGRAYLRVSDQRTREVIWSCTDAVRLLGLRSGRIQVECLADRIELAMQDHLIRAAISGYASALDATTLAYAASGLMLRRSGANFDRAREILTRILERHPRLAIAHSLTSLWAALGTVRGNNHTHGLDASALASRSLDLDPTSATNLAIAGYVECHVTKDLDRAHTLVSQSLMIDPSHMLSNAFMPMIQGLLGRPRTIGLQPACYSSLPGTVSMRSHCLSVAATVAASERKYDEAISLAKRSLVSNPAHSPTWRLLTIANVFIADLVEARTAAAQLLALQPEFTVARYTEQYRHSRYDRSHITNAFTALDCLPA